MLALVAAGSLAFLLTRHAGTARTTAPGPGARAQPGAGTEVAIRNRAAAWVASQVSRAAPISCDQVMCLALGAHGIPIADLHELMPGRAGLPRSGVVVETAAVRSMAGSRLVTARAPAVIASFGSGSTLISVRAISRRGAAAYSSALRRDIAARKEAGTSLLLENQRITASAAARRQLAAGQVDPRLVLAIANLASQRPLSIVAFGDLAPGADPGIPFRSADLAETGGTAGPDPAAQVRSMSAFLHRQGGFYRGAHVQLVRLAGGGSVLRIEFAAPSPLGLLGARG